MVFHQVFTVGHSAMGAPVLVKLLRHFEISLLIDVRSNPRSLRFPQFDREELTSSLKLADIQYLFLGEELGGRPEDLKAMDWSIIERGETPLPFAWASTELFRNSSVET
jgi:uncharacterized protein (DUF488 family)